MNHGPIAGLDVSTAQVWTGHHPSSCDTRNQPSTLPQRRHALGDVEGRSGQENLGKAVQTQASRLVATSVKATNVEGRDSPRIVIDLEEPYVEIQDEEMAESTTEGASEGTFSRALPYPRRPDFSTLIKVVDNIRSSKSTVQPSSIRLKSSLNPDLQHPDEHQFLDSYPWTGNHPEDRLTEQVIKNGYSEKPPFINESNSARPTLWPHFKNKTGLQALGSLFTSILQQKQQVRRVDSVSTFKPPPRVTLTDTKREAWLRDLANLGIPLRRLSRTIPHGIRGKALLDQCVAKKIPVARAIWFAKCVGANEIRASKRKGVVGVVTTSSESKWVKEWTAMLETFIEDTLNHCAAPDAAYAIPYALQISIHFYQEGLLDRDQFLDWQLGYFERCPIEKLPASLLLIRAYLSRITADFRSGRRLTKLCLHKLSELSKPQNVSAVIPLVERLQRLCHDLVVVIYEDLVLDSWNDCRPVLLALANCAEQHMRAFYQMVVARNDRLSPCVAEIIPAPSPSTRLFDALDKIQNMVHMDRLCSYCVNTVSIEQGLILFLLQWAASDYRDGHARRYLVVRVIQKLSAGGLDINEPVLGALYRLRHVHSVASSIITHVLIGLTRLGIFDCARYMRWLMTVGALNGCSVSDMQTRCDVQFLGEMPLQGVSANVLHLRSSLLRRLGVKTSTDESNIVRCEQMIAYRLPELRLFEAREHVLMEECTRDPSTMELSIMSALEVTSWLRNALVGPSDNRTQLQAKKEDNVTACSHISRISLLEVRRILERFNDFSTLAEVMESATASGDPDVLRYVADTLDAQLPILVALGLSLKIYGALLSGFRNLQTKTSLGKETIATIMNIGQRLGVAPQIVGYLERERKLCDDNIGVAAFTPISDIMCDSMSNTDADDEVERLLNTTCSLDTATLNRIFNMCVTPLQQTYKPDRKTQSYCASMVAKLVRRDKQEGSRLMNDWTRAYFLNSHDDDTNMVFFFRELVAAKAFTLRQLCNCAESLSSSLSGTDANPAVSVATRTLGLVFAVRGSHSGYEDTEYRYIIEQTDFCLAEPRIILQLLCQAASPVVSQGHGNLVTSLRDPRLLSVVRKMIMNDPSFAWTHLDNSVLHTPTPDSCGLSLFVCDIIDPRGLAGFSALTTTNVIVKLFETVDAISLPFAQYVLRVATTRSRDASATTFSRDAVIAASRSSLLRDCLFWKSLMAALDVELRRAIREFVEIDILTNYLDLVSGTMEDDVSTAASINRALSIVKATTVKTDDIEASCNTVALLNRLNLLKTSFEAPESSTDYASQNQARDKNTLHLNTLLELSLTHFRCSSGASQSDFSFSIRLLGILCPLLCITTATLVSPSAQQFLADVVGSVAASLTPTALVQLISSLSHATLQNSRIRFFLGIHESPDAWLHVIRPQTPQAPAPKPARPTSEGYGTAPFALRRWELLPDLTANVDANDTALSLGLFDARKL